MTTPHWHDEHPKQSTDYAELVKRLRSGEVVDVHLTFNGQSKSAQITHRKTGWGEIFNFNFDGDYFVSSSEAHFLADCDWFEVKFALPADYLQGIRKQLEIAKNAAEFRAVSVPLNSLEELDALWALVNR